MNQEQDKTKQIIIKVEPYWNVKLGNNIFIGELLNIKVEPYWNVKSSFIVNFSLLNCIKVEPYWNVKFNTPPI